jgi:hypothetical protein
MQVSMFFFSFISLTGTACNEERMIIFIQVSISTAVQIYNCKGQDDTLPRKFSTLVCYGTSA